MRARINARETARAQPVGAAVPETHLHLATMHEVQLLLLIVEMDARAVPRRQNKRVDTERVDPERRTDLAKPGAVAELFKAADGVSAILGHERHILATDRRAAPRRHTHVGGELSDRQARGGAAGWKVPAVPVPELLPELLLLPVIPGQCPPIAWVLAAACATLPRATCVAGDAAPE